MPMGTPLVAELSHVSLVYEGGVRALDDVSLTVAEGERLCILGANGSGKSTLASVLCGLLAPDEGDVTLLGERVLAGGKVDFAAYGRARRRLGLVFQNPDDQIVTSVVEEDVAFGPENLGVTPQEIGQRVEQELRRTAMGEFAKADPTRLSGGQKQRVAIAGALAMHPRVLVLDEPGALLDVRGRRSVMRVMARLKESGTTVVHITHFMEEALAADRVIVMCAGRVALSGTPAEVFSHSGELRSLGLHEPFAARLAGRLQELGLGVPWTTDEEELAQAISHLAEGVGPKRGAGGREEAPPRAAAADDRPLAVELREVCYSYQEDCRSAQARRALEDVSLGIAAGDSLAIVGQTGSGKSTLLRLVCGLELPDSGSVRVLGVNTARRRERRLLRGRVGYVMQHPERQLFAETVALDVAFGPTNLGLPADEVERRCQRALELVGLLGKEGCSPFELSGGQQRMCAIAGILAMQPELLVLDEPMAGLDPLGRERLAELLGRIKGRGCTIVQVTHSMDGAALADRVFVLDRARVLAEGRPEDIFCAENEDALHDAGLGLPTPLAWALALRDRGVHLQALPLTTEGLARAIARACQAGEVR